MKGSDLFLNCLQQAGVRYIFGNPGTTEAPLIDRIAGHPPLQYITALHEGVAVGMADAYAQASGQLGVANVHVAPGLGNSLGMLYNAWAGRTPLLVTAGQIDSRILLRDPLLTQDLVQMAAPLVKWSVQAQRADDLPLIVHRAVKTAFDPPCGPVFLSLPVDVLEQESEEIPMALPSLAKAGRPDPAAIRQAVEILLLARSPVIIYGDEAARQGIGRELSKLAEFLAAPVWATLLQINVGFPMDSPLFQGELSDNYASIHKVLQGHDTLLLVGGEFFREVFMRADTPFDKGAHVVHLETDPGSLGRNFSPDVGIAASLRATLEELMVELDSAAGKEYRRTASERLAGLNGRFAESEQKRRETHAGLRSQHPMVAACLLEEIQRSLPENTVIVGEAISASDELFRTFRFKNHGDFIGSRGGGIGQGLAGGPGVKLANPERPVAVISGDGSSMYSIQSLWSAARHNIPVIFIILNNQSYRVLKINLSRHRKFFDSPGSLDMRFMNLEEPLLDFVSLAKGFGVAAQRVERLEEVALAIKDALDSGEPFLVDCIIGG